MNAKWPRLTRFFKILSEIPRLNRNFGRHPSGPDMRQCVSSSAGDSKKNVRIGGDNILASDGSAENPRISLLAYRVHGVHVHTAIRV